MSVTTIEGIVEDGMVRLPQAVRLPEHTKVYVVVPDLEVRAIAVIATPRLVHPEQAADFAMEVTRDAAHA